MWALLAHDYLSIMSSSVSSKHAFSQGGITINKWRNRLKGDIVEALQCCELCDLTRSPLSGTCSFIDSQSGIQWRWLLGDTRFPPDLWPLYMFHPIDVDSGSPNPVQTYPLLNKPVTTPRPFGLIIILFYFISHTTFSLSAHFIIYYFRYLCTQVYNSST